MRPYPLVLAVVVALSAVEEIRAKVTKTTPLDFVAQLGVLMFVGFFVVRGTASASERRRAIAAILISIVVVAGVDFASRGFSFENAAIALFFMPFTLLFSRSVPSDPVGPPMDFGDHPTKPKA